MLFPPEPVKALHGQTPTPALDGPPPDLDRHHSVEKGHGRIEVRRIAVSQEAVATLAWPGAAQICRIERSRDIKGRTSREIAYAITSLTKAQASPGALLALNRAHWSIENTLHWRRDVVLGEDASRVRSGAASQAMAALRNAILRLVHGLHGPLREIRQTFAENRIAAIATVKNGFL